MRFITRLIIRSFQRPLMMRDSQDLTLQIVLSDGSPPSGRTRSMRLLSEIAVNVSHPDSVQPETHNGSDVGDHGLRSAHRGLESPAFYGLHCNVIHGTRCAAN